MVAELVDAPVSKTGEVTLVPVRSRPVVQKNYSLLGSFFGKSGDVDKIQATTLFNLQIFIFLLHFRVMSKKFVFSVVAKSQRKMVFV